VLGIFIWSQGKSKRVNIIFFLLCIVIAGWVFTNLLTYYLLDYQAVDLNGRLTYAFSILIVPLFLTFTYYFPRPHFGKWQTFNKIGIYASWILGVILVYASIFTDYIQTKAIIIKLHLSTIEKGKYYFAFFVFFLLFVIWGFVLLFGKYRNSRGVDRQKISMTLLGFGIAAIFGVTGNLFFMGFVKNNEVQAIASLIGPIFTVFLVGCISYAILKFRFIEISMVVKRGAVRLLSFVIIFGIYLFVILLLKDSIASINKESELTYLIIITLLVVLTVEPIRKLVYKYVDKIFETRDENRKKVQILTQAIFTSTKNYEDLISSIIEVLKNLTNVEHIRYAESTDAFFSNHKSTLECLRATGRVLVTEELPYRMNDDPRYPEAWKELQNEEASLFLPMGRAETYMGSFIFGKRKNHAAYTIQEIKELESLQYKFGEALFNVRLYKQAVERIKL
jgi:hypothetical protein